MDSASEISVIPGEANGARRSHALLTAEEVAERLQVSTGWVYAQSRSDRIPHVRLGRYVRFREDAVEKWLVGLEVNTARVRG